MTTASSPSSARSGTRDGPDEHSILSSWRGLLAGVTQPAGFVPETPVRFRRQTRAGLLRRKRSLVRRLPRGGVGEPVVLGDCVRLAGQKARVWWLRRHRHVEQLPIVRGMRRQAAQLADPLRRARTHHHPAASVQRSVRRRRYRSLRRRLARSAAGRPHRRHPHLGRVLPFRDNLDHAKPQPGSQ